MMRNSKKTKRKTTTFERIKLINIKHMGVLCVHDLYTQTTSKSSLFIYARFIFER